MFFAKTLLSSELPLLKININELYVDGYYTKVNYELENKYEKLKQSDAPKTKPKAACVSSLSRNP